MRLHRRLDRNDRADELGTAWRAVREAAARHRATLGRKLASLPCGTSSGAPPDVPGLSEEAGAAAAAPSVPRRA